MQTKTRIQERHARCPELPACFAEATLAAAVRTPTTEAQRASAKKAQRQALRLVARGELTERPYQLDANPDMRGLLFDAGDGL